MMTHALTPDEKLISKKATFHKYCRVHIKFNDGTWENGYIEDVGYDYLVLKFLKKEAMLRWKAQKKPFFFMQIKDICEHVWGEI